MSEGRRTLVIGAGPIGLRMAIECAFLGKLSFVVLKCLLCVIAAVLY